jgi:hypothetical protein
MFLRASSPKRLQGSSALVFPTRHKLRAANTNTDFLITKSNFIFVLPSYYIYPIELFYIEVKGSVKYSSLPPPPSRTVFEILVATVRGSMEILNALIQAGADLNAKDNEGNTAKAIEHYEKFLSLWKDADPGIAAVEDARRRLVGGVEGGRILLLK